MDTTPILRQIDSAESNKACFYDVTLHNPAMYDLSRLKTVSLLRPGAIPVRIDPAETLAVMNYFEEVHGGLKDVLKVNGQLQLCYGLWDGVIQAVSVSFQPPSGSQKCIIFALRRLAAPKVYTMSEVQGSIYWTIAARLGVQEEPEPVEAATIVGYIERFASPTDRSNRSFEWLSGSSGPDQITQSIAWLQRALFPPDIVASFNLEHMHVVDAGDMIFQVNDAGPDYGVRGKTDAILAYASMANIMAVIELKKHKPEHRDFRQLLVQLYALQRASDTFSVFGVLTDLQTTWKIVYFDSTTVAGRDVPCYFDFFSASMALPCIRALICGNLKRIRRDIPNFVCASDINASDEGSDDADERTRNDRRAWKRIVHQRSAREFKGDRPTDKRTGIRAEEQMNDDDEPFDEDLYQRLAAEGVWDGGPSFSEMSDAADPEGQQKLLASAIADLEGLSRNQIMARLYASLQEDRKHEEERLEEAARLARERVQALHRSGVS